jgi:hypothetical protein
LYHRLRPATDLGDPNVRATSGRLIGGNTELYCFQQ